MRNIIMVRGRRRRRVEAWTRQEDEMLREYVNTHGPHHWDTMARNLGIGRSGNSCRLRWFNHLSPDIRRGEFTHQEILMILYLHREFGGNRWARIARELPGRTDNHIKNFWNTQMKKEAKKLNCHVQSDEFLQIMTARFTEGHEEEEVQNSNYSYGDDQELITTPIPEAEGIMTARTTFTESNSMGGTSAATLLQVSMTTFGDDEEAAVQNSIDYSCGADDDCSSTPPPPNIPEGFWSNFLASIG